MPEWIRASITSSTPSLNLDQWRSKPGFVGLVATTGVPSSSPNRSFRTVAIALLFVEWPDKYSGCCGVGKSGVQAGSPSVRTLPSSSPFRMAVIGRQKLNEYLAAQHAMLASADARYI